jgi:NADH:ubiquinone oxidoreductase subunit C
VAEQLPETAETVAENPLKILGAAIAAAAPQGTVTGFTLARGGAELAVHANRDQLLALMLMLRDDPRFSFEQCMDICGVDWPSGNQASALTLPSPFSTLLLGGSCDPRRL